MCVGCCTHKIGTSTHIDYKDTIVKVHLKQDTVYKIFNPDTIRITDTIVLQNEVSKVELYKLSSGDIKVNLSPLKDSINVPVEIPIITHTITVEKKVYQWKLIIILMLIIGVLWRFK